MYIVYIHIYYYINVIITVYRAIIRSKHNANETTVHRPRSGFAYTRTYTNHDRGKRNDDGARAN